MVEESRVSTAGPTQAKDVGSSTSSWLERRTTARAIRFSAAVLPTIISFFVTFAMTRRFPAEALGLSRVVWWACLIGVGLITLTVAERLSRRLLPLAGLLTLALDFPNEAPSRFRVAMRSRTTKQLERSVLDIRRNGMPADDAKHAEVLLQLVASLSRHDRMTRGHCERVRAHTDLIAEELNLSAHDANKLRWAALAHDVGKLFVPSEILNKPGRPDETEWEILKSHAIHGERLITPLRPWLGDWADAVGSHHERWDGDGYPRGLSGANIHIGARIVAVADAYDVMTSTRSYKKPISAEKARAELARCAGSQFDPNVVRAFLSTAVGRPRIRLGPLTWLANLPFATPVQLVASAAPLPTATAAAASTVAAVTSFGLVAAITPEEPPAALAIVSEQTTVESTATDLPPVGPEQRTPAGQEQRSFPTLPPLDPPADFESSTTTAPSADISTSSSPPAQAEDSPAPPTIPPTAPSGAPPTSEDVTEQPQPQRFSAPTGEIGRVEVTEDVDAEWSLVLSTTTGTVTATLNSSPELGTVVLPDPVAPAEAGPAQTVTLTGTYSPAPDVYGSDSFEVEVCDADRRCTTAQAEVTIDAVDDPPSIVAPPSIAGLIDAPLTIQVQGGDVDSEDLIFEASGLPTGISINPETGLISGTPTETGVADIVVSVSDQNSVATADPFTIETRRWLTSSLAGQVTITEVLARRTRGAMDEFVEIQNTGVGPIDLTTLTIADWNLRDGAPDKLGSFSYSFPEADNRGNPSILAPGQFAVIWIYDPELGGFDSAPSSALEFSLGRNDAYVLKVEADDVWILDASQAVVDYMAWGVPGTVSQGSLSPQPDPAEVPWSGGEIAEPKVARGQSLSLASPDGANNSACWERTETGSTGGRCPGAVRTKDTDSGRQTSAGLSNL